MRADWVPALGVLGAVVVLGLPLGALWCWLAPTELVMRRARATTGSVVPFAGQNEHHFDDMATFVLFGLVAGMLTGAALWLFLQRCRGPLVLLAAVLGSLVAAWLAVRTGLWLAAARYPGLASTGVPFQRAPVLQSSWVIITQPFGVAVAYCIATAWSGTDERDW